MCVLIDVRDGIGGNFHRSVILCTTEAGLFLVRCLSTSFKFYDNCPYSLIRVFMSMGTALMKFPLRTDSWLNFYFEYEEQLNGVRTSTGLRKENVEQP